MLTPTHRAGTTLVASSAPTTQTTSATPSRRVAGTGVTCRSAPSHPTAASASADSHARRATESVSPAAVSPHALRRPSREAVVTRRRARPRSAAARIPRSSPSLSAPSMSSPSSMPTSSSTFPWAMARHASSAAPALPRAQPSRTPSAVVPRT